MLPGDDRLIAALPDTVSQRDQAYHRLRRLLILQKIPVSKRLCEPEWADRLGVNRVALREAFARLEAEGLIEKGPKTGYFVPNFTSEDTREILEVRIMLETGAIERMCRMRLNRPRRLRPMRDACDQLDQLIRDSYALGVAEADQRFHTALVEAADSKRLSIIYKRAPLPLVQPQVVSREIWAATTRRTLKDHRAILSAIRDGHAHKAQRLLCTHLAERALTPLCTAG